MAVFTALAIAGLVMEGVGAIKQAHAAKNLGEAQAEVSTSQAQLQDYNAGVADLQAQDALDRGALEEARFRTQVRGAIGAQRTGFAAGGVDVGFGSAVDVQADAARLGEYDALTIRTNAAREAWGYKVQAADMRTQAEIDRKAGKNQIAAGDAGATNAYLGGAARAITGTTSLLQAKYGFNGSR